MVRQRAMNSRLQRRFDKLQRQKRAMVAEVARLSAAQVCFRPVRQAGATEWSIAEVMDHLVRVEEGLLAAAKRHLSADAKKVSLKDRLASAMVIGVMLLPVRVKVPSQASVVLPCAAPSLQEIFLRWDVLRAEMMELLTSLEHGQSLGRLFRHPVGGWMTIGTALDFLSAHLRHHRYQIGRIRAAGNDV